jgi:hypothetical protein
MTTSPAQSPASASQHESMSSLDVDSASYATDGGPSRPQATKRRHRPARSTAQTLGEVPDQKPRFPMDTTLVLSRGTRTPTKLQTNCYGPNPTQEPLRKAGCSSAMRAAISASVHTLHHHRNPLPPANTSRSQPILLLPPPQLIQQRNHQPCPRRSQRMPQRNRPAIHVHLLTV